MIPKPKRVGAKNFKIWESSLTCGGLGENQVRNCHFHLHCLISEIFKFFVVLQGISYSLGRPGRKIFCLLKYIMSAPYHCSSFGFRIFANSQLKFTLYNFRVALRQKVAFNVMLARPLPHIPFLVLCRHASVQNWKRGDSSI